MVIKKVIKRLLGLKEPSELEILRKNGLKVGSNFNMQFGCSIDPSHCWLISIGENVTLAPGVRIIAHDASTKMHLGYTKVGKIKIGNQVFIGAGSIILPNVTIGDNVVIGAGTVVAKDIPDNSVVAGNPAKIIGQTDTYLLKNKELMSERPNYDGSWTLGGNINEDRKREMAEELNTGIGFVV